MSDLPEYLKTITVEKIMHEIAEFIIYGSVFCFLKDQLEDEDDEE